MECQGEMELIFYMGWCMKGAFDKVTFEQRLVGRENEPCRYVREETEEQQDLADISRESLCLKRENQLENIAMVQEEIMMSGIRVKMQSILISEESFFQMHLGDKFCLFLHKSQGNLITSVIKTTNDFILLD